jgi:benzoate membrane transport protein
MRGWVSPGAPGVNLAAITAAICTGKEAHEDADRRYVAGVVAGAIYAVVDTFGGALALPPGLIAALGAAFRGLVIGAAACLILHERRKRPAAWLATARRA